MKNFILATSLVLTPIIPVISVDANALTVPGGVMKHKLSCQILDQRVGVGYGLLVKTQALAPQYNVRGISLLSWVVYPNAPITEKDLEQLHQDATSATFASPDGQVKVELDKRDYRAEVFFDGKLALSCKK